MADKEASQKKPVKGNLRPRFNKGRVNEKLADRSHKRKVRLHSRAVIAGYRRNLRRQYMNTSILKIEGCKTTEDARFYLGKKVAYIFRSKDLTKRVSGPKSYNGYRVLWGRVTREHGNSGAVRARFTTPLPPNSLGQYARVMLYPSNI